MPTIGRHLPGRHDQMSHAGGRAKALADSLGKLLPDDQPDDSLTVRAGYLDWTTRGEDGSREFEAGAGDDAVLLTLTRGNMQQIVSALSVTLLRDAAPPPDPDDRHSALVAALMSVGERGGVYLDDDEAESERYLDWSTRSDDGSYEVEFGAGGDAVTVPLTPDELAQFHAQLTRTLLADGVSRSRVLADPALRELLKKITSMKGAKAPAKASPRPAARPVPKKTAKPAPKRVASGNIVARGGLAVPGIFNRTFALEDIQISRGGDGRTVEAYAAMFDTPYEVHDQHGHYFERIDRAAFNRTLTGGAGLKAMCLYNHGMTVHGTPDGMASIPLGTPLEIRPDGRGLLTVTRYNRGPFADQVLEAVRNGDIRAQSFRGKIYRSDPKGRLPRRRYGDPLPTVTRHELGLSDYGPTPIPVNEGAEIVAVRSVEDVIAYVETLDAEEREELLRSLSLAPSTLDDFDEHDDEDDEDEAALARAEDATPDDSGLGAEDPPADTARHSGRQQDIARRIRVAMLTRGIK